VAFVKHNCNIANTHKHDEIIIYIAIGKLRIDLLGHRARQPPHTIPSCFRLLINIVFSVELYCWSLYVTEVFVLDRYLELT